jgi:hypothetical protein
MVQAVDLLVNPVQIRLDVDPRAKHGHEAFLPSQRLSPEASGSRTFRSILS